MIKIDFLWFIIWEIFKSSVLARENLASGIYFPSYFLLQKLLPVSLPLSLYFFNCGMLHSFSFIWNQLERSQLHSGQRWNLHYLDSLIRDLKLKDEMRLKLFSLAVFKSFPFLRFCHTHVFSKRLVSQLWCCHLIAAEFNRRFENSNHETFPRVD